MIARIAFLGTGLMGAPMVGRILAAGLSVRIWNRSSEKMQPLIDLGAVAAVSPGDAVSDAQLVCFCLTDGEAIAELLFGPAELAETIPARALILDFSTIGPKATRALASRLQVERSDIAWIDAPVSGGMALVVYCEERFLCGGDEDAVASVRPVLSALAKRVCHLGPLGSGQAAKLCNQLIVSANIVAIAEALVLGREQGLDISELPGALAGGWADSLPLQIIGSRMAAGTFEPPVVSVGTYVKDLALVLDSTVKVPQLAAIASEIYTAAAADGQGVDVSSLIDRIGRGER